MSNRLSNVLKTITLPNDIQKINKNKILKKIITFITLEIVAIFAIILLAKDISIGDNAPAIIAFSVLAILLPFFISKVHTLITDRSWCGEIISVEIIDEIGSYTTGGAEFYPHPKQTIVLDVKLANGKLKKIKAKSVGQRSHVGFAVASEGKIDDYVDLFTKGDIVCHILGFNELLVVTKEEKQHSCCLVCGTKNSKERTDCLNCGHTIVHIPYESIGEK